MTRGQCITQPGSSNNLEALNSKIMNQPIYRKFGTYEGIVLTHLVDKGEGIAAPRWYELRKTSGNWKIYQQSTYSPSHTHRWMPSICYNANGDIAIAYNASSAVNGVYPGARYTGRNVCNPLNQMTYGEHTIVSGSAANASTRYGDYNHLVCDPDGVTFWFTFEYNAASTWNTKITSFTLGTCNANCGTPSGLASSSIQTNSATVSWSPVTNALSFDLDYKQASSNTWINKATATTLTSVNISGLTQGITYDWRVRATCDAGSGDYVSAQFTTITSCKAPGGLTASSITVNSAILKWTAVSNALNYDVDYKLTSGTTWISKAKGTTSTSVQLSGLISSSQYSYRVRANCSSADGVSSYSTGQFTTSVQQSPCVNNYEPNETQPSAILIDTGTVISAAISTSTDVDFYKFYLPTTYNTNITLTNLPDDYDLYLYDSLGNLLGNSISSETTNELINFNNTAEGYFYIKVIGYNGASSTSVCYNLKVSPTFVSTNCAGLYDNLGNGFFSSAVQVPFNTDFKGRIKYSGDLDFYKFTLSNNGNISISATTLAKDYDIRLYNSSQAQLAISQNRGTANEIINYNVAAGTYYVKIYGYNNAFDSENCYTLNISMQSTGSSVLSKAKDLKEKVELFPNPAQSNLNINILGYDGISEINLFDVTGRKLLNKKINKGLSQINISALSKGVYMVKILNRNNIILSTKIAKD